MKIIFEREQGVNTVSYCAVVQSVKYKGRVRDELLYATIKTPEVEADTFVVDWEDEWNSHLPPRNYPTLDLAKAHVLENYKDHEPVILGPSWDE